MAIVDALRFFEKEHRTALSKYRGKPWFTVKLRVDEVKEIQPQDGGPYLEQGWEIRDKVTDRHLANVYTQADSANLVVPVTFIRSGDRHDVENAFASLGECAQAVWEGETVSRDQRTWKALSWLVWCTDLLSTLAKFFVKIGLSLLAIFAILYALSRVIDEGTSMIGQAIDWLLPEKEAPGTTGEIEIFVN